MLKFDVTDSKKLRVIVDTDAACEADDPFAIVHALLSPKLIVKGIVAEHFNVEGSVQRSFDEIETILEAMDMMDIPHFIGEEGPMYEVDDDVSQISPAVQFIIDEALREDTHPLYILCQGAITNVAVAMKKCPKIIERMNVIWIGTHGSDPRPIPFREFNAGNDVAAANFVLESGVNLTLVPSTVYSTILIGIAEIQRRISPCGKIGKHLFDQMVAYNNTPGAGWTAGESWSLGDSPAIAIAINPGCGHYRDVAAPHINDDTSSSIKEGNPVIREYIDVDSRYILEDLIAKLELFALS